MASRISGYESEDDMQLRNLSTIVGVGCLVLAISGWLLRVFAFMHSQMSALADTVPRMPQACEEMGEVNFEPFLDTTAYKEVTHCQSDGSGSP